MSDQRRREQMIFEKQIVNLYREMAYTRCDERNGILFFCGGFSGLTERVLSLPVIEGVSPAGVSLSLRSSARRQAGRVRPWFRRRTPFLYERDRKALQARFSGVRIRPYGMYGVGRGQLQRNGPIPLRSERLYHNIEKG